MKKNNKISIYGWNWRKGLFVSLLMGQIFCLSGCSKEKELVFQTENEQTKLEQSESKQTESSTDVLALQELEQVEAQADKADISAAEAAQIQNVVSGGNGDLHNAMIYVDICGAVKKPGVYQVKSDSRLFEVIDLAGGLNEDAASRYVNQARTVIDGEQVVILTEKEAKEALASGVLVQMQAVEVAAGRTGSETTGTGQSAVSQSPGRININTASVEELTTLSGIGENKAKLIIQYRQDNGGFSSTEEIMNIEGIGEKTYAKFAEQITVQ